MLVQAWCDNGVLLEADLSYVWPASCHLAQLSFFDRAYRVRKVSKTFMKSGTAGDYLCRCEGSACAYQSKQFDDRGALALSQSSLTRFDKDGSYRVLCLHGAFPKVVGHCCHLDSQ